MRSSLPSAVKIVTEHLDPATEEHLKAGHFG
jgi:hypothetical protein